MKDTTESQWRMVFDHMLLGCKLTSLEALQMFGIISFPKRICEIEKHTGIVPKRERIEVTGMFGKKKHVYRYWIEPSKVSV